MKKIVAFNEELANGESLCLCSNPKALKDGKCYSVAAIDNSSGYGETLYRLKGVSGWFYASWFEDVYTSFQTPLGEFLYNISKGFKYLLLWLGLRSPKDLDISFGSSWEL